jgi:hypothetical protein
LANPGAFIPVPTLPPGERCPDEVVFQSPDNIVARGLPYSRVYDGLEELARVRQVLAAEAAGARAPRPSGRFHTRSLRRI